MTFRWMQSTGGHKVSEPLPNEVMASASVAAVTRGQVSKLTHVSSDSALPSSELDFDSSVQETAPVADLSQKCKACC